MLPSLTGYWLTSFIGGFASNLDHLFVLLHSQRQCLNLNYRCKQSLSTVGSPLFSKLQLGQCESERLCMLWMVEFCEDLLGTWYWLCYIILSTTGWDPNASKSNRLQVDIFHWLFCIQYGSFVCTSAFSEAMFEFELEFELGAKVMFASLGMPKLSVKFNVQIYNVLCSVLHSSKHARGTYWTTLPKNNVQLEDNSTVSLT